MLTSFFSSIFLLAPVALLMPAGDEPPITIVDCGGQDTVYPPPGTVVTGVGDTYADARAALAGQLGLVCSVCSEAGCEMSVGKPGNNFKSDIYRGSGGSTAIGRDPGGPVIIAVAFGEGGQCRAHCSACGGE